MARSNCITSAVIAYLRMRKRWAEQGSRPGQEPYLLIRGSRDAPAWVPHMLVGRWADDSHTTMIVYSLKPTNPKRRSWWSWWRLPHALRFDGRVVRGD